MSDIEHFSAEASLAKLRPFQRATVDHVIDILYKQQSGKRFLVADETGLGKSVVASGVIAKAIEHLQDDPNVKRIDIVYICSNADIARQNIKRLNVTGNKVTMSTRLSMLATATHQLSAPTPGVSKPVNLVSLTPQTSFPDGGWRTGTADERALLFLILRSELSLTGARATAAFRILQGTVSTWHKLQERARRYEAELQDKANRHGTPPLDPVIVEKFLELGQFRGDDESSPLEDFEALLNETVGRQSVPGGSSAAAAVIIRLRRVLARAGVEALEPDLVILDEFQRFTDLLKADLPVSELAQEMFTQDAARVLLLSATPYKSYDLDDGVSVTDGSTHRSQFMDTLDFLAAGLNAHDPHERSEGISKLLSEFRDTIIAGDNPSILRDRLRVELLGVMCRTERPTAVVDSMVLESRVSAEAVTTADVRQFMRLTELAELVGTRLPMDVWKSVPALANFMGSSYQLGRFTADQIGDADVREAVARLERLDPVAVARYDELPRQNPRLESLMAATTGAGWEQLLWVPPSVPYLKPGGPYADPDLRKMTKKLVFSQWSATPTAVASLLSHDASRRIARSKTASPHGITTTREYVSQRLQFRRSGTDLAAMNAFMLFFPLPGLADETDPLRLASAAGRPYDPEYAEIRFAGELTGQLPKGCVESGAGDVAALMWQWPLMISDPRLSEALRGSVAGLTAADAIAARVEAPENAGEVETATALDEYVQQAISVQRSTAGQDLSVIPTGLARQTARLALHSPANCAWRAFGRLDGDTSKVSIGGRWRAAGILASGLRTLFNRWESSLVLDELYQDNTHYWQKVIRYCADGNLQAVLDEYLFHLAAVEGESAYTDESLIQFADKAARALKLNPAIYKARDPLGDGNDIDFRSRFALRYGETTNEEGSVRAEDVREAFNSPFWPFVLVSTSVGQEGIDFHPWCHNLVHWNTPGNPVDFEQRDGRVNRFRGHAVRRNIVAAHSAAMLATGNPWKAAYDVAARDAPHSSIEGLAPDWVYPGPFKVLRDVMPYQLSTDQARIEQTKKRVAYYRLAFGQARQEDLISVVAAAGVGVDEADQWRVDLRPPQVTRSSH
ncbi:helicase-related protein [Gordonia sp. NPDC003950]